MEAIGAHTFRGHLLVQLQLLEWTFPLPPTSPSTSTFFQTSLSQLPPRHLQFSKSELSSQMGILSEQ